MVTAFESAFYKAFHSVFQNGTHFIEKTINIEKFENEYDIHEFILDKAFTVKNFKKMDNQISKGAFINQSISSLESAALGVLGIGLPDIPVFIGVILKTIYEICLQYGFHYDDEKEKVYILYIICTAVAKNEEKRKYAKLTDEIGKSIDENIDFSINLEEKIKETSQCLCSSVIGMKMLQGIAVIGICSSAANFSILGNINKIAKIKYKKRFLEKYQSKVS